MLNNIELNISAIADSLPLPKGLKLVRGFSKGLRIRVPWNALRSKSIEVNFDTVEIIVARAGDVTDVESDTVSVSVSAESETGKPSPQKSARGVKVKIQQEQQSWAKPLLKTIGANVAVNFNNLVVKLQQGPLVCACMFSRIELSPATRSDTGEWVKGFSGVVLPDQPIRRFQSFSDVTISLQIQRGNRNDDNAAITSSGRKRRERRCLPLEKPLVHRASFVVYAALPPSREVSEESPPLKSDIHIAPFSIYCTEHHVRVLLALIAGPEAGGLRLRMLPEQSSEYAPSELYSESAASASVVRDSDPEHAPSLVSGSNRLLESTIEEG